MRIELLAREGAAALLGTSLGEIVAEARWEPVAPRPTPLGALPLRLRPGSLLHEHVITLRSAPQPAHRLDFPPLLWRGRLLEPLGEPGVELRPIPRPAGQVVRLVYGREVLSDPGARVPCALPSLLAAAHRFAGDCLLDPFELHAQRLHHAAERLREVRLVHSLGNRALSALPFHPHLAEIELLHLCATGPSEDAVRETSLRLAREWEGGAAELLALTRDLLAL